MVKSVAVVPEAQGNRGETHQRAVSCGTWIGRTGERVASLAVALERIPRRDPNVEAAARARVFPVPPPRHESTHQVPAVKALRCQQAFSESQRHGRVVSPATGPKLERPAASDVDDPGRFVSTLEFQSRSESIAHC